MILSNEKMFESLMILAAADERGMLGYAIARNRRLLAQEVQEYSRTRDQLLEEYGRDVGGGKFELQRENAEKFVSALKPYNELTADIPVMQIPADVFYSGNLTSGQMYALEWMVKDDGN